MNHKRNDTGRAADQAAPTDVQDALDLEATVVDPALEDDLGAEYEMRGDLIASELEQAKAQAEEYRDRYVRLQAEWDNFRKRTAAERAEERMRATQRLVEEILPVIDDLERALAHAAEAVDVAAFSEGVAAVQVKLLGALARENVSAIDPTGEPFDATRHQAVGRVEDTSVPDETVSDTYSKGYEMAGRVLRPAVVVVTTGGPRREGE